MERAKRKAAARRSKSKGMEAEQAEAEAEAASAGPRLHDECDTMQTWDGPLLVAALQKWLKFGHVVNRAATLQTLK